ncbi:hypothetical protein DXC97_26370 [Lachnospiraceae bacterium TF09-5]|nr:hypothetical protein DXC97_26370 [Lachnospiraceae bacterium TF09-5]
MSKYLEADLQHISACFAGCLLYFRQNRGTIYKESVSIIRKQLKIYKFLPIIHKRRISHIS